MGSEMCIRDRLVLVQYLLTILEDLSSGLAIFVHRFTAELVQKRFRNNDVRVFLFGIENDVEQSNRSAGVHSLLLHVEDVAWYFLWF